MTPCTFTPSLAMAAAGGSTRRADRNGAPLLPATEVPR